MGFVPWHKGVVYVPERATKEKNLTLYTAFGGVAIQNRIAASFVVLAGTYTAPLCHGTSSIFLIKK